MSPFRHHSFIFFNSVFLEGKFDPFIASFLITVREVSFLAVIWSSAWVVFCLETRNRASIATSKFIQCCLLLPTFWLCTFLRYYGRPTVLNQILIIVIAVTATWPKREANILLLHHNTWAGWITGITFFFFPDVGQRIVLLENAWPYTGRWLHLILHSVNFNIMALQDGQHLIKLQSYLLNFLMSVSSNCTRAPSRVIGCTWRPEIMKFFVKWLLY